MRKSYAFSFCNHDHHLDFYSSLSCILVADFTLELRHLNSAKIEATYKSLSTVQFSNAIQHVHQSFLVELATPEDTSAVNVSDL